MDTAKTRPFFCKIRNAYSRICRLLLSSLLTLRGNEGLLLSLLIIVLFAGCKTVPIHDRNFSEKGSFWEQDEHTGSRFHHTAIADDEMIGLASASNNSVLLNGSQVKISSKIKNNSFVSTGSRNSAHIKFKPSDSACLIRVDEFDFGKAYADTSDCQYNISTIHAVIQAKNAILHVDVSQYQTEIMVISGMIKVMLRENTTQSIDVKEEQEIIITRNAIGRSRPIAPDEIWQRIRWRNNYQFYKTVVDWNRVLTGAVTVVVIAAAILLSRSGSRSGLHRHQRWRY